MAIKRVSMLVWLAILVAVLWPTQGRAHPIRNVAAAAPGGAALLAEVRAELAAMRTTRYQHTTAVNAAEGEYFYDCSGFLDYALQRSLPTHLAALPVSETKGRPLAQDFEHHFRESTDGGPWRKVATVADLRPGDVIAWLATPTSKTRDTGHVMVVLREPEHNPRRPDEWTVEIADSTSSPHARDSRGDDEEGLGTGTVGLSVDGSGRPVGFYWRGGVSRAAKLTDVSLGRAW
ncbi:hypothetical protein [Pseudonocardia acaciae]|uniref:hypothetical protein n=1 Tax=Pseudonocardia acaciae TaxID=551276 RepID=UPI00048ED1C1|nr:hypothetical protein [Pseudonocardia acaciae]